MNSPQRKRGCYRSGEACLRVILWTDQALPAIVRVQQRPCNSLLPWL